MRGESDGACVRCRAVTPACYFLNKKLKAMRLSLSKVELVEREVPDARGLHAWMDLRIDPLELSDILIDPLAAYRRHVRQLDAQLMITAFDKHHA